MNTDRNLRWTWRLTLSFINTNNRATNNGRPEAGQRLTDDKIGIYSKKKPIRVSQLKRSPENILILIAGGFSWSSTLDFAERTILNTLAIPTHVFEATNHGYGTGLYVHRKTVNDASQFFDALKDNLRIAKSPISRILFLGHGSKKYLGLSGNHIGESVKFTKIVSVEHITNQLKEGMFSEIRKNIMPKATFDLCACHCGENRIFMKELSNLLALQVRALPGIIEWTFEKTGKPAGGLRYRGTEYKTVKSLFKTKYVVTDP